MSKNTEAVKVSKWVYRGVLLDLQHNNRIRPQVVVRCRPLNSKEQQDGRARIVDMDIRQGQIQVPKTSKQLDW